MSLTLSQKKWARVTAFQREEVEQLAMSREFAASCADREHYSRIGHWLDQTNGSRLLEIGCGPGRYVAMLSCLGFDVVGVDPAEFPTWEIIRKHTKAELANNIYAESIPFPDASFDAVACMGALLYFKSDLDSLREIRRVLKPGGRLVVRTVNRNNPYRAIFGRNIDPATQNVYTEDELRARLEEAGFDVAETSAYGFYPPVMKGYWWYLVNGTLSMDTQERISNMTPRRYRSNIIAYATRRG